MLDGSGNPWLPLVVRVGPNVKENLMDVSLDALAKKKVSEKAGTTYDMVRIYLCIYMYMHIHTHTDVHTHIYIYIYVCVYVYIYIYIYISVSISNIYTHIYII